MGIPSHDLCVTFSVTYSAGFLFLAVYTIDPDNKLLHPYCKGFYDQPRWLGKWFLVGEEEVSEAFGSEVLPTWEVWFWRLRWPTYILLRAIVTNAFTDRPWMI